MKKFNYKFTKLLFILLLIGLLIAVLCLGLNVKRIIEIVKANDLIAKNIMSAGLAALVGLIGIIVIVPVFFSSRYEITNTDLITRRGIIVTKIKINTITRITFFRATKKLVLYYNQSDYVVIVIDEKDYNDFVDAIKEQNKKVFYAIETERSDESGV